MSWRKKTSRVHTQIRDMCAILCGLVVAQDFRRGQQLITERSFADLEEFFQVGGYHHGAGGFTNCDAHLVGCWRLGSTVCTGQTDAGPVPGTAPLYCSLVQLLVLLLVQFLVQHCTAPCCAAG